MRTYVGIATATALLALAQGCKDERRTPPSTCTPTPQTAPDPAGVEQHCLDLNGVFCSRSFGDCPALGGRDMFATVDECYAEAAAACASSDFSNEWLDETCAGVCVGFAVDADCSTLLMSDEPQACAVAVGSFPPEVVATITPGTFTDTIPSDAPLYEGGPAHAFAISFTAGQRVVIETAPPSAGTEIFDTFLYLLPPGGIIPIAENDDVDWVHGNYYSRIAATVPATGYYTIVVRGDAWIFFGSYDLTVTVQ